MGLGVVVGVLIGVTAFMGYDAACYRLVRLVKGPNHKTRYTGHIPGYSIYYYHKFIKKMEKEQNGQDKNNDT